MTLFRLTIGIPAYNRPDLLSRAVASALAQSTPCKVLVSVQHSPGADPEGCLRALRPYGEHPWVRVVEHDEYGLWANWTAAAREARTLYFAWLQDDDVLAPHFAQRVIHAFGLYQEASCYAARVTMGRAPGAANWWQGAGPLLPMDMLTGHPTLMAGEILAPAALCTAQALSPAVAFRWSDEFVADCERQPEDCGLYYERTILAAAGRRGPMVCDPAAVGVWLQHSRNESRRALRDRELPAQRERFLGWIEAELEAAGDAWGVPFLAWLYLVPDFLDGWIKELEGCDLSGRPRCRDALAMIAASAEQKVKADV